MDIGIQARTAGKVSGTAVIDFIVIDPYATYSVSIPISASVH